MSDAPDLGGLVASMPFAVELGIELLEATAEQVTGRLEWTAERCTVGGTMHGGVVMSLGDTVGAVCAFLNLPPGAGTATLESKTNLFRGVRGGSVRAVARPLHVGRTTIVVQSDLWDDDDRRVAQVTQTQAVLPAR
jgi:1,4-dihydroxy-2-naphthoyl-CoA hydrolase